MFKKLNYLKILLAVLILTLASCKDDDSDAAIAKRLCSLEEKCYQEEFFDDFDNIQECVDELLEDAEWTKLISNNCYKTSKNLYNCLSNLSCAQLDEYMEETTPNYPCASQEQKAEEACWGDWDDYDWDDDEFEGAF